MSQNISEIGTAGSPRNANIESRLVTETVAIAYVTSIIYLMAGAYELGWQDQFSFTYISLGVEDIVAVMRQLIAPLLAALSATVFFSFLFMLLRPTSEKNQLISIVFLVAPVCASIVFYIRFARHGRLTLIDKETYWLLLAYYFLDVSIWRAVYRLSRSSEFQVPLDQYFRMVQIGVASLLIVVVTYDVGVIDALDITDPERCPDFDTKQSILVQRTSDLVICAQTDFSAKVVYKNFFYFKIPDNGEPRFFRRISFHPDRVGVELPNL